MKRYPDLVYNPPGTARHERTFRSPEPDLARGEAPGITIEIRTR